MRVAGVTSGWSSGAFKYQTKYLFSKANRWLSSRLCIDAPKEASVFREPPSQTMRADLRRSVTQKDLRTYGNKDGSGQVKPEGVPFSAGACGCASASSVSLRMWVCTPKGMLCRKPRPRGITLYIISITWKSGKAVDGTGLGGIFLIFLPVWW